MAISRRPLKLSSGTISGLLCAVATTLAACPSTPAPTLTLPVIERGQAEAYDPDAAVPDEPLRAFVRVGVEAAAAVGPAVRLFTPLLDAVRLSREKHPPQTVDGYRLAQADGWRFLAGGWVRTEAGGVRSMRATIENLAGEVPAWDVIREENYTPDLQAAFPAGFVRTRLDVDQALPSGARLTFTLIAPLGARGQALAASGTGSIAATAPASSMSFKSLNARIGADGTVERGDIVLFSQMGPVSLLLTGTYGNSGLANGAILTQSARALGQVIQVEGGWAIRNGAGTHKL